MTKRARRGAGVHFYELAVVLLTVVAIGVLVMAGIGLISEDGTPTTVEVQGR